MAEIKEVLMINKKTAFTLAEVLLVLAIIGVIAAVTIPAIMQQSSEKKFAALAKKTFSTLQNAINLKIATSPVGPGDLGISLFEWLLEGDDDGTNTLKVIKTSADSTAIQTPDGVILRVYDSCGSPSTRREPLGRFCSFSLAIDLNGAEPPTKTTMNNLNRIQESYSKASGYDTIWLEVDSAGKILPGSSTSFEDEKRARKYLGLSVEEY